MAKLHDDSPIGSASTSDTDPIGPANIFKLGQAHGSFACGNIDQGVDIVLPTTNLEHTESYNTIFEPLFKGYFDLLNGADGNKYDLGLLYMGAVEAWCQDNGIVIESVAWIKTYEDYIHENHIAHPS